VATQSRYDPLGTIRVHLRLDFLAAENAPAPRLLSAQIYGA